jgi:hypothetical protein
MRDFGIARMSILDDSVRMPAIKKTASRHGADTAKRAKKFFSAAASGSLGAKKASRKPSKHSGVRDRVPDEQARLFADVMRATARSLAA